MPSAAWACCPPKKKPSSSTVWIASPSGSPTARPRARPMKTSTPSSSACSTRKSAPPRASSTPAAPATTRSPPTCGCGPSMPSIRSTPTSPRSVARSWRRRKRASMSERLADGAAAGAPDEDVHTLVERLLYEEVGAAAGKLHTGRSRNDQVATDLRLWTLDAIDQIDADLATLGRTLVEKAKEGVDV